MKHIFHIYHPLVVMMYILSALVFTMLSYHPGWILTSLCIGSVYSIYLNGFHRYIKTLLYVCILFIIVVVMNPLFNHNGITIIFYLFDNPVTMEALMYGVASGGMLASILVWFTCYNALVTNEKFLYLFGKPMPTIALMLSMIIRLVPVTQHKMRAIRNAQQGMRTGQETRKQKIQRGIRISSILMSWSMEDCIETADSMKARGYGSTKRTSFSMFRWCFHDSVSFAIILLLIAVNAYMVFTYMTFQYFPTFSGNVFSNVSMIGYGCYAVLLLYPLLLELRETIRWK